MKGNLVVAGVIVTTVAIVLPQSTRAQTSGGFDTAAIGHRLEGIADCQESVFEVSKRRSDMKIKVDQWIMPPFMGLTSWTAFTRAHIDSQGAMAAEAVVFEDEFNPVMNAAFDAGLEVTALRNHFFDDPKVYFMHIGGHGEMRALAAGVKKIHDKVSETRATNPSPVVSFPGNIASPSSVTAAPLETALGMKGQANQDMFKVVIGRTATLHGLPVGKKMRVSTWASVAGGDEEAVLDGDFAMLEGELQPVLRRVHKLGTHIVAIDQHMSTEQPRYFFLPNWGKNKAVDLAQSLKGVLDDQAAAKS